MKIVLHIERLVLEELSLGPPGGAVLAEAMLAELGRLLAAGGLAANWRSGGASPYLRGPTLTLPPTEPSGRHVDALGARIAASVHACIGGGTR
ncbi:hypothetical protein F6X40_12760 [Paraburkholderia sp. UCT31]|uniref:hypothetical protein n=1 Tax=Paraburkholderia sp. UCT31 TaxID=2615209 RepID=UPI001655E3D1|nr:hypothetical protein [Paraburkholderia sp. UCT31]MBC8737670.1 hypothetical protein [Paraburkholderia sp. UCT31]